MNAVIRFQKPALIIGLAGLLVLVIGALSSTENLFRAYLIGYLYWLAVALGCLPLLMLHHLTGGEWGFATRRILESGTRTLPIMALLFIPIPLGMHSLYEWSHPEVVANDLVLQAKTIYLNVPFFVLRAIVYFALWIGLAYRLNRLSAMQDHSGSPSLIRAFQLWSAPGILLYVLTVTFASVDWVMSLEPHWFSTIYGMLFAVNQVLATLAFVIILATLLSETSPLSDVLRPDVFHDLGNLLLAFVMLWAYLSFSQFLIIWSGNLPEEIPWYVRRSGGGWQWVAAVLALFHFAVPLVLLLARGNKRRKHIISGIAIGILAMRYVDTLWLIKPAFTETFLSIHWLDIIAPCAIGGLWISAMIGQLQKMPLVPLHDPDFERGQAGMSS